MIEQLQINPNYPQPIITEVSDINPSYANQLGLVDGSFNVIRSNGKNESGWCVSGYADGKDGKQRVVIEKIEDDQILTKTIPLGKFLAWQQPSNEIVSVKEISNDKRPVVERLGLYAIASSVSTNNEKVESPRDPRLAMVFKPILSEKEIPRQTTDYSYLFELDEEKFQKTRRELNKQEELETLEKYKFTEVNDQSRNAAIDRLKTVRQADKNINNLINLFQQSDNIVEPKDVVEMIRTNTDLRYALGEYLLEKKLPERLNNMPERIVRNTNKNPNHRGYGHLPNLSSREYAVLLALSMIDGSFQEPARGDEVERDASGRPVLGQHRGAAEELLS